MDVEEHLTSPGEIFNKSVLLDELVDEVVFQSNLYAQQQGRMFQTNAAEIKAFLGINFVMSINKLPTIHHYWETDTYIGNTGIRDIMTRGRFKDIC